MLDIQSPSLVNGIALSPEAGGAHAMSDEAGFNRVFREELRQAPAPREIDPRADVKALGRNFMELENQLRVDRAQMLQSLLPTLGTQAAHGDGHRQGGSRGLARDTGFRTGSVQSGGGAPGGAVGSAERVTAVYSDASVRGAPVVQSALGLNPHNPTNDIDFNGEIRNVSHRLESVMEEIRMRISDPRPKSSDDMMRHNSEVHSLVRESDNLNTQRSMLTTLHLTSHQETRTRMLSTFEHVVGMVKKINEIFNQLKQGS